MSSVEEVIGLVKKQLTIDEDVRYSVYQDHLGFWTIGVGRLVDSRRGGRLSPAEVDYLLSNDIRTCLADIGELASYKALRTDVGRAALLNMRFQLGASGFRSFKNSLSLLAAGEFKKAGVQLRKSKWHSQTPARSERVIQALEAEG